MVSLQPDQLEAYTSFCLCRGGSNSSKWLFGSVGSFSVLCEINSAGHEPRLVSVRPEPVEGVVFHSVVIVKPYRERARTATGLKVTVELLAGVHAMGKKCSMDFIEAMRIVFDDFLPRWNYRAIPAMAGFR